MVLRAQRKKRSLVRRLGLLSLLFADCQKWDYITLFKKGKRKNVMHYNVIQRK